jgi:hypothetical protein
MLVTCRPAFNGDDAAQSAQAGAWVIIVRFDRTTVA